MKQKIFAFKLGLLCVITTLSLTACNIAGIFDPVNNNTSNVQSFNSTTSYSASSDGAIHSGSSTEPGNSSLQTSSSLSSTKTNSTDTSSQGTIPLSGYLKGIWISYFELNFSGKTEAQFKAMINGMFDTIKNSGLTAVFCHVRPNSDAYYPSSYFPWAKEVSGTQGKNPGYDPLGYMVTAAHQRGLSFHAWINPYRVSSKATDASGLSDDNPAKKWFTDGSRRVLSAAGGLYYNPAKTDVQKLVINGVKEILDKYPVDGIHFDDYFYPTTSESFDNVEYSAYKASGGTLSLGDWRRTNVNILVNSVYAKVHNHKNVVFGISPAPHISTNKTDKNYTDFYADIPYWISRTGYVDYIIPQLYFGYEYTNPDYRFDVLLNKWDSLPRAKEVKMYVGLGAYKIGTTNSADNTEWTDSTKTNLLARQATDIKRKKLDGVVIYSYGSLFSENDLNKKQRENLLNALK